VPLLFAPQIRLWLTIVRVYELYLLTYLLTFQQPCARLWQLATVCCVCCVTEQTTESDDNTVAIAIGVSVGLVCIVVIVIAVLIYRYKSKTGYVLHCRYQRPGTVLEKKHITTE